VNRQHGTECTQARTSFSGYLDGTISGREMQSVAAHLEACLACMAEFSLWRGMQRVLSETGPVKAPADLGLKLRLAISHEKSRRQSFRDDLAMRWDNFVRPLALQALSGLAGALLLFGGISMLVGVVAVPNAVLAHDEPLGAVTMPHYLYSAALQQPVATPDDGTIVVEADINAQGKVYDWNILSGPTDERTRAAVADDLMLQVYEPSRMFGQPVRGRVLVTFSGVLVKG
jgi:anti-sigma factor RsiW